MSAIEKSVGFWLTSADLANLAKGETPDEFTGSLSQSDMSDYGWFKMREFKFTIQLAEFPSAETAVQIATQALQAEKQRIYAEAADKARKIDVQLANLQSLVYDKPVAAKESDNDAPF